MSDELLIELQEELALVQQEMEAIDNLFDETKEHFDKIKQASRNGGGGSLSFIHLQTANLISLKSNKLSLIKERVAIKKIKADLDLKQKQLQKGAGATAEALSLHLYNLITENNTIKPTDVVSPNVVVDMDDDEIDAILEARIAAEEGSYAPMGTTMEDVEERLEEEEAEAQISEEEPEEEADPEEEGIQYAADDKGNLYVINSKYEILDGYDLSGLTVEYRNGIPYLEDEPIELISFDEE